MPQRTMQRRVTTHPKTAVPAKITRPVLKGVCPRTRLFRALDRARERSIVWISAPAGSGKTTLVVNYVQTRQLPTVWYQGDAGDSDVASFFYYLGLAAKVAAPRHRKPLPLWTPEHVDDLSAFTVGYFREFFPRPKR